MTSEPTAALLDRLVRQPGDEFEALSPTDVDRLIAFAGAGRLDRDQMRRLNRGLALRAGLDPADAEWSARAFVEPTLQEVLT